MRMRRLSACAVTAVCGAAGGGAWGQTYTWTGVAGANWFTPGSWLPMAVPPVGASVVIPANAPVRVQLEGGVGVPVDLASIDAGDPVDVRREAAIAHGVLWNPGINIPDPARRFSVSGLLRITGSDTLWIAGTLSGGGELWNEGIWFVGGGTERRVSACTLRNMGTMRVSPVGSRVDLYEGGTILNEGLIHFQGSQGVSEGPGPGGGGRLVNEGVLRADGVGEALISCELVNMGRVEVNGAGVRLRLAGRVQDHRGAEVALSNGATLTVMRAPNGAPPRLGGIIGGTGDFVIGPGQHVVQEFLSAGLGPASASGLLIDAGTVSPTIELLADLESWGKATWRSGAFTGAGVLRNRAGATLTVAAGAFATVQGELRNEGMMSLPGVLRVDSGLVVNEAGGTVRVQPNGGFVGGQQPGTVTNLGMIVKEGTGTATFSGGAFTNTGTVRVAQGSLGIFGTLPQVVNGELTGGTWISEPGAQLNLGISITKIGAAAVVEALSQSASWMVGLRENRGRIIANVSGGISGPFRNLGNGRVTIRPSVTMSAASVQNGEPGDGSALIETLRATASQTPARLQVQALENYGRLAPGGAGMAAPFTLSGALTMRPASRLEVEIGGMGPGLVDELVASGEANLGGILALSLLNGFVPAAGQEFVVLRAGGNTGVNGTFDFVAQPPGMPGGLAFSLVYGETMVTARVGPACYANCDGSAGVPALNVNDFVCFAQRFAAGEGSADCDLNSLLNVNDLVCFQGAFAAGCR